MTLEILIGCCSMKYSLELTISNIGHRYFYIYRYICLFFVGEQPGSCARQPSLILGVSLNGVINGLACAGGGIRKEAMKICSDS